RLPGALAAAKRNNHLVGLYFMDLYRFKAVNDTLRHAAGDKFLVEIAKRLNGCLRTTDTVARFGGDEFVFIINDLKTKTDAEQVLKKILDAFHIPVTIGDQKIPASASIGVSLYPQDGKTIDELLKRADTSMYRAKSAGNNLHCYHIPQTRDDNSPCMQSID
ncbi:MAG: GGDEF domain-containing protein, partial [Burkholderiales bacterium]|nr:GGDEF domain-containing protein [Burkholderiales bacterium]